MKSNYSIISLEFLCLTAPNNVHEENIVFVVYENQLFLYFATFSLSRAPNNDRRENIGFLNVMKRQFFLHLIFLCPKRLIMITRILLTSSL